MQQPIALAKDTIDNDDIDQVVAWLKTYPRLTKGEKTLIFEKKWAEFIGTKYAVFVNSGSSANLLALYTLLDSGELKNRKVVVPAISWITDISPVIQFGMQPILCDCNMRNLAVDVEALENIFKKEDPSILMLVSVLGLVPDMDEIVSLCIKYGVYLIVDNCESLGSTYENVFLERLGAIATCSTYFGHTISTIEGGIVTTDTEEIYKRLIMLRSHGWDRDLPQEDKIDLRKLWGTGEFESLYTFYTTGFNLRSTDLQAFIGIGQLAKLPDVIRRRNANYGLFNHLIKNSFWKPEIKANKFVSNLGYPVIHPEKKRIVEELIKNKVEVRPLISGSMGKQPFYQKMFGPLPITNADIVTQYGLYLPNHPYLTKDQIEFMASIVNRFTE